MTIEIQPILEDDFPPLAELYPWPQVSWIKANFVQSLNGKVTDQSKELFLASQKDKYLFRYLRATADCIVIGRNTAINQPYKDIKISKKYLSARHTQKPLQLIIISNKLDFASDFFSDFTHKPILLSNKKALASHQKFLPFVIPIELGEEVVDLNLLKPTLTKLGFNRILCEGGAELITQLVNLDILDEIDLTISKQLKSALESSLFTANLKPEKEDHFYFRQILFDHENLFVRILKK